MANQRREETRSQLNLKSDKQKERERKSLEKAEREAAKVAERRAEIEKNGTYEVFISGFSFGLDILDGVLGFLEMGGDLLMSLVSLVYVYISLFVVRSLRLTAAVLTVALVDAVVGFIPVVGSAVDFVFCANYINKNLIKGFVEGNKEAQRRVNILSSVCLVVVAVIVALIVYFVR